MILLICLATHLTGSLAWAHDNPVDSQAPEKVVLQLKWLHQFQFAGYYAALSQGYYRRAGLEVELVEAAQGRDPAKEVAQGRAQYGIGTSDLVLRRSQGFPLVALGAIFQHSPLVLLALADKGLDTVHDLDGKRLAMESDAAEILAYLKSEGLDLSRVKLLPHNFSVDDLAKGKVEAMTAYSTDEPFNLRQAGLDYRIFSPRSGGIDFYGDTLFTSEREIREHPERARRFLEASLRGWRYALEHPQEIIDLILTQYGSRHGRAQLEFEAQATRGLVLSEVVEVGYMNPGRWRYIADTYASLGMMPKGYDLKGFLYDPSPRPDLSRLYLLLAGALVLAVLVGALSLRYYRLSRSLRAEMSAREAAQSRLRESEERYRLLLDLAPLPVVISSLAQHTVVYLNARAEQMFQLSLAQVEGREAADLYQTPQDRQRLLALLSRHDTVDNFEALMRRQDGTTFWASLQANITRHQGQPVLFTAVTDITTRRALEAQLREAAERDALTGIFNRRRFLELLEAEVRRAHRYGHRLSVLMLDIDFFKKINDLAGHQAGDRYLRLFALGCQATLRQSDVLGRIGGEEFAIFLPDTPLEQAAATAERLRRQTQALALEENHGLGATVSIGAVQLVDQESPEQVLERSDQALYRAKAQGRNQVALG